MSDTRTTRSSRLWNRATQTLGKLWAEVISLPDRPQRAARADEIYPRFPWF